MNIPLVENSVDAESRSKRRTNLDSRFPKRRLLGIEGVVGHDGFADAGKLENLSDMIGELLLFEKFSQLRVPASLNTRGTGLGLAIVREVVHLHGGTVRVESQRGKGATFIVSLPLYNPTFALTEEFRVIREQAAREGRILAVQLFEPRPHKTLAMGKAIDFLSKQVSREDHVLENPTGGIVILSVLDAEGFPAMRKRLSEILDAHPQYLRLSEVGWGWAFVPREETTLAGVLGLAKRRAHEDLAD